MSNRRVETSPTQSAQARVRPRSPAEALEPTRAPSRPRGARIRRERPRLNALVRWMSGIFTLLLVFAAGIGGAATYLSFAFDRPGPLDVTRTIAVPRGEGRIEIAARLEREGIIANRWVFVASHLYQSWGNRQRYELKAGEYEIRKQASMRSVLNTLVEGRSVLAKISLPEGLTSQQIVERMIADPNLTGEITQVPAEGTMLPETYRFSKGMSRQDLIERLSADQQKVLAALWEKRQADLPLATPQEALILASIVEKETGRNDERDRVAAVFVNRLRKGMRLQSDPTIIYGIVGGQGSLGRPITRSDIDGKTAYNTYQIDGLPPGPICNPGRSAIEAVLNPAKTSDLFFVADGTGGHTFSQTLKEHNAAVSNWRKVEREMRAKAEAASAQSQTRAVSREAPPPVATPVEANVIPLPQKKPRPKAVERSAR